MKELTDCSWAEELNDFFRENYEKDLAREAREIGMVEGKAKGLAQGRAEGLAEAMNMVKNIIKSYISTNPYCSIEEAAAQLGVEEQLIRSLYPSQS